MAANCGINKNQIDYLISIFNTLSFEIGRRIQYKHLIRPAKALENAEKYAIIKNIIETYAPDIKMKPFNAYGYDPTGNALYNLFDFTEEHREEFDTKAIEEEMKAMKDFIEESKNQAILVSKTKDEAYTYYANCKEKLEELYPEGD